MSLRTALLGALLLTVPAVATAQATTEKPLHPRVGNETELGQKYTKWFFDAQYDSLWAHMNQDMRDDLGEPAAIAEHREQFISRTGEEVEVLMEVVMMRNGAPQYWRTSNYTLVAEPVMLRWVIVDGEIWGVGMNLASQAPPTDPEQ